MDEMILSHLNSYCSALLGEPVPQNVLIAKKKKKKKSLKNTDTNICENISEEVSLTKKVKFNQLEDEVLVPIKNDALTNITSDGFKITSESELPPDDSDLSDAFESDSEEECNLSSSNQKVDQKSTEDGFKICHETFLEPDDSDISDAFESDLDEDNFLNKAKQTKDENNKNKEALKKLNKPLRNLISDFGLEETIFNKEVLSPKSDSNGFQIIDHSQKRGNKKKRKKPNGISGTNEEEETNKINMKKARYEVYQLGASGFGQQDKETLKINMAIKLGAKAPKKEFKNYKLLMEERKVLKKAEQESLESMDPMERQIRQKEKIVKEKVKEKEEKKKTRKTDIDPMAGVFKHGMLKLSKSAIKEIQKR